MTLNKLHYSRGAELLSGVLTPHIQFAGVAADTSQAMDVEGRIVRETRSDIQAVDIFEPNEDRPSAQGTLGSAKPLIVLRGR